MEQFPDPITVTGSLKKVIPAYLYQQYFDDADLTSFFYALNAKMQGYVDWFNSTPLGVYTSNSICGPLLDWVGMGVYGIPRPATSNFKSWINGAYNSNNTYNRDIPYLGVREDTSGSSQIVSDDVYKRVLTWYQYAGDGRQASIMWLRRRVARFIYGVNGTDVSTDTLATISIYPSVSSPVGAMASAVYDEGPPYNGVDGSYKATQLKHSWTISVPDTNISATFQALVSGGVLALPFQVSFSVVIQDNQEIAS